MTTTDHGESRIRERLGVPKRAAARAARLALERGIPHTALDGAFRKYLNGLISENKSADKCYVYGNFVYLFGNNNYMITTWELPRIFKPKSVRVREEDGK